MRCTTLVLRCDINTNSHTNINTNSNVNVSIGALAGAEWDEAASTSTSVRWLVWVGGMRLCGTLDS